MGCGCWECREEQGPRVFVVVERCGDGYHAFDSELHAAYFDSATAEKHADQDESYEVVEVPIAPHTIHTRHEHDAY